MRATRGRTPAERARDGVRKRTRAGKRVRPNSVRVVPPIDPFTDARVVGTMSKGQTRQLVELWRDVLELADAREEDEPPLCLNIHSPACLAVPGPCVCEPCYAILRVGARA